MIGLESLRWLLTLVFAGTGVFHLVRALRPGPGSRFSEALHLVMSGAMIVMIWPWGMVVPIAGWVSIFTLCAGWFATRAVRTGGSRAVPVFFASSMAMMVWMGAAMSPMAAGPAAWIGVVLGTYLVAAAFWWIFRGLRAGAPRWPAFCHGMMSAGMGLALLATF